jgi:hypothetical protein
VGKTWRSWEAKRVFFKKTGKYPEEKKKKRLFFFLFFFVIKTMLTNRTVFNDLYLFHGTSGGEDFV